MATNTPDRDRAEAAWKAAKNDAWAADLGRLVKPINLDKITPAAIEIATANLRAALDAALKKAAVSVPEKGAI